MPIERLNLSTTPTGRALYFFPSATIHTTGISSTIIDVIHVWAYAANSNASSIIDVYYGPITFGSQSRTTIPAGAILKIIDGAQLSGDGTSGNSVLFQTSSGHAYFGYILRITP